MSAPLMWTHRVSEIADAGLSTCRTATASERSAIARALDVVSCEAVTAEYVIRPLGEGRYRMSGKLTARLTQQCVVTLEGIPQTIEESFDVEFCPIESLPESDAEVEVLSGPDVEPIERGLIAAGRIIFELISATLEPYPRKPGVSFHWEDEQKSKPSATGPFAALKKLKEGS